jgi:hypothetical protein
LVEQAERAVPVEPVGREEQAARVVLAVQAA